MNADKAIIVDGVLKEIGDRLFWDDVRPMKARRTPTGLERKRVPRKSTRPRADFISRTIRKVPEVMVKISGGGKSIIQIKAHLDYISRNGDVVLENENGDIFAGKEDVRDLRDIWRWGGYPIVSESSIKQSFNIILSMPPSTDRPSVTNAARDFAKSEFGDNYSYVFATHDDEKHPHVHICVKAMGKDGVRLNPRKADLQSWRELFAEKLIDHGIEANATRRPVRGVTKRPKKQPVVHMEKRGLRSMRREALKNAAEGFIRHGIAISNPLKTKIQGTRQFVVESWNAIGHALQAQGTQGAQKLHTEVTAFVHALHEPLGVGEQLEKQLRLQMEKQQQKTNYRQKGSER